MKPVLRDDRLPRLVEEGSELAYRAKTFSAAAVRSMARRSGRRFSSCCRMGFNCLDSISSGFPPFWAWPFSEPFSFTAVWQIAQMQWPARIDRVEERSRRGDPKSSAALGNVSSARAGCRPCPCRPGFGSFPDRIQYSDCTCGDDAGCDRRAANDARHRDGRDRYFRRLDCRALRARSWACAWNTICRSGSRWPAGWRSVRSPGCSTE